MIDLLIAVNTKNQSITDINSDGEYLYDSSLICGEYKNKEN
jgi:hypothetical protein